MSKFLKLTEPLFAALRYLKSWIEYGWAVLILLRKPFPLAGRLLPGDLRDFYKTWTTECARSAGGPTSTSPAR